jgi:hypothetical protein
MLLGDCGLLRQVFGGWRPAMHEVKPYLCESHGDMRKFRPSLVEAKVYEHWAFPEVWIGD